jgi:predicted lipid-binding transport protein (Tim44 family)
MTGLMVGLAGAALGHILFGSHLFSGFFGFLIEILLLVLLVRWVLGWLAERQVRGGGVAQPLSATPLHLQPADFTQFSHLLTEVQSAWSDRDPSRLRTLTTPDMLRIFENQLADLTRAGRRNVVSDIRLLQGDLSEAWTEGARDYATVAMRYAMRDVTYDDQGRIVDGTPNETVTVTELWTFVRGGGGGWILSAIQQPR